MKYLLRSAITITLALAATLGHAQATNTVNLTWQDTSCTATTPCVAQVFRAAAACPSASAGIGNLTYTELTAADTQPAVAGAYTDSTAIQGQTYCYYVTDSFVTGGTSPSSPSNTFQLTLPITIPATPTGLVGTIVAGN